jgi:hypothetical protein
MKAAAKVPTSRARAMQVAIRTGPRANRRTSSRWAAASFLARVMPESEEKAPDGGERAPGLINCSK